MSAEQTLLAGIGSALTIAGSIAKLENGPRIFLAKLGWDLPPGVEDIGLAGLDMARIGDRFSAWVALESDPQVTTGDKAVALAALADSVIRVLVDLRDLRLQAPQDYLNRTRIKDEFLTRLFDLYLIQSAAVAQPAVFDVASLLGWFELRPLDADPAKFQVKHLRHVVHWDRLPMLLTDPTKLLRETYSWGTATFNADILVTRLGAVLQHLAAEVKRRELPAIPLARLHGGTPPAHQPQIQLFLPLIGSSQTLKGEAGISVFGLPPTTAGGVDGGIGFAPYAEGATSVRLPLSSTLSMGMSAQADLGSGLALLLRPGHDPVMRTDLNKPQAGTAGAGAEVNLDLTRAVPQGSAAMTLLAAAGATLEATSIAAVLGVLVDSKATDCTLRLQVKGGKLSLKPEGLPFIENASRDGIVVEGDVDLAWSSRNGVRLDGRAELKVSKAIGRRIGPVTINFLEIGLATSGGGLAATVTVSVSVKLGPVRLLVDQIGVRTAVTPGAGSLGSADLTIKAKPPSGVGIKVDSPFVTGGGFLSFDQEKGEYAGAMLLNIDGGITVTAIGVIATKLPNHAKGFSFVVMITAQGFKPIPLGLGFTLTAIGGLLAINRRCNEEFLREGIQNNTLNHLFFPKDPIRNAPQIFGTLNKAFPPRIGSYLFGPVVQICWGTPPVLTMDLALVLELGNQRRLIILGRVSAILPTEKHDQIRLQMNAFGVIDFDQKSISLDAVLYDSRLVGKFPITGSMAMRLRWGSAPIFALSIGGFHPAFKPPPSFPVLKRLAISLSDTKNFRLRIECYLAITSNTLQFGAKVELMARAGRFSIEGRLSFDVLIQFDPFFFQADFQARVQLKLHSHNLFSVGVKGQLSGPRPLHIKGKATFGIFWCHFSVRFDKTLVEGERPPQLEPINVLEQLIVALKDSRNWSGQLAEGERRAVTLREVAGVADHIPLHPLGQLSVKQTVVPLELEISKFGNRRPEDARLFKISSLSVNGTESEFTRVKDFFAPGQFLDLSEDEKLAAPSFEAMVAGIIVGAEGFMFTTNDENILEDGAITYETIIVDEEFEAKNEKPRQAPPFVITAEFLNRHISLGPAARSDIRRTGTAKYRFPQPVDESRSHPAAGKNSLEKKGWTIASTEDGSHQGAPGFAAGKVVSYSESFQALQVLKRENPAKAKTLMLMRVSKK